MQWLGSASGISSSKKASVGEVTHHHYLGSLGDGVYVLGCDRYTYSHSRQEDNSKASQLTFKVGDVVTVELDPASGRLTYIKAGCPPLTQESSIRSTTAEPVHFCLVLNTADASIVAE